MHRQCGKGWHWASECSSKREIQGHFAQLGNGTEAPILRPHSKKHKPVDSYQPGNKQAEKPQLGVADLTQSTVGSAALDLAIEKHLHYPHNSVSGNLYWSLCSFAPRDSRNGLGKEQCDFPRIGSLSRNYSWRFQRRN